jgi:CubicO group peptidase (beta-lactamase class C family)
MLPMLYILLRLLVATGRVYADPIDDFIRAEMQKQKVPGLSVAVIKDGKVVKARGYGFANLEHQVPAKRETVYQTGSVGKQFAAMAAMLLLEEGKLALDDLITQHLPDVPAAWQEITVRHLLTHTSGIKRDVFNPLDRRRDYTEEALLKKLYTAPVDFPPGTDWAYSNTGYAVLGILVSKVAGKFYGDYLKERVFTPLEMTTARIISEADIIPHRAAGYEFVRGRLRNQAWVSPTMNTTADGSMYVTIDDMIKWDAALTEGKLLKKEGYEAMWTPVITKDGKEHGYGFGWFLDKRNGHKRIHHAGGWQGFSAHIDRYPEDKLTVIVLANLSSSDAPAITGGIAALMIPELAKKKGK